jgi:hypothetical protein
MRVMGDERILARSDFVEQVLGKPMNLIREKRWLK